MNINDQDITRQEFALEIEQLIANAQHLPEWEKEIRRKVYWFMEGSLDMDITEFLNIKLGWSDTDTIRDYAMEMEGEEILDRQNGMDATFAIDFMRLIRSESEVK